MKQLIGVISGLLTSHMILFCIYFAFYFAFLFCFLSDPYPYSEFSEFLLLGPVLIVPAFFSELFKYLDIIFPIERMIISYFQ